MKKGAFALLDCLGFRGIWKTKDSSAVIKKFHKIEQWASSGKLVAEVPFLADRPNVLRASCALLSDTIALSVTPNPRSRHASQLPGFMATALLVQLVSTINHRFVTEYPSMLLRGCITYGEHSADDRFIIGPAVDSAAENEKLAEGAFIWLDPSASREYSEYLRFMRFMTRPKKGEIDAILADETRSVLNRISAAFTRKFPRYSKVIHDYPMPIKGGRDIPADILAPLLTTTDKEAKRIRQAYSRFLQGDRLDIRIKRRNTMKYLDICDDERARQSKELAEFIQTLAVKMAHSKKSKQKEVTHVRSNTRTT